MLKNRIALNLAPNKFKRTIGGANGQLMLVEALSLRPQMRALASLRKRSVRKFQL